MYFSLFNVEIIHEFALIFVPIWSNTSYSFGFTSRVKILPFEMLKFLLDNLRNKYKKVALVWVDEDGTFSKSSESMKPCYRMNILVQTTGDYAYSLNGKSEITNKVLANIKLSLMMNPSHNKYFFSAYHYDICLSKQTNNRLRYYIPYFQCDGTWPYFWCLRDKQFFYFI